MLAAIIDARMPEWSKGADLRSASESCVGSNPTPCIFKGNPLNPLFNTVKYAVWGFQKNKFIGSYSNNQLLIELKDPSKIGPNSKNIIIILRLKMVHAT